MNPSFLRFPGGCVTEGSYYRENFYDWKDTVGPIEERKEIFNTWGYMQSYGLGYYEYFMLSEAIGAEPLPVVHSGLLCQARDVKEAPLTIAETRKYAQDLLDLIEFANGDCVLYDPETRGCRVYRARPVQCRTWPFWSNNIDLPNSWKKTAEFCKGCDNPKGRLYTVDEILAQRDEKFRPHV